jgi:hypothetical protein
VRPRLRLVERVGQLAGFSAEGRALRVWTQSRPGEEDATVVPGTLAEITDRGGVLALTEPVAVGAREARQVLAVPAEPGWGFDALWFGFIAVDTATLEGEPIGRWWLRLRPR